LTERAVEILDSLLNIEHDGHVFHQSLVFVDVSSDGCHFHASLKNKKKGHSELVKTRYHTHKCTNLDERVVHWIVRRSNATAAREEQLIARDSLNGHDQERAQVQTTSLLPDTNQIR
jgi:hypothetical protein